MNNSRRQLKDKPKKWLIELLDDLMCSDQNACYIALSLIADDQDMSDEARIVEFEQALDKAAKRVLDYGAVRRVGLFPLAGFDAVADVLYSRQQNHPKVLLEASEYALVKLDSVFHLQRDNELETLVQAFRRLHVSACEELKLDPFLLGRRLAELRKRTKRGFFDGPPVEYADVLNAEGMRAYCRNKRAASV